MNPWRLAYNALIGMTAPLWMGVFAYRLLRGKYRRSWRGRLGELSAGVVDLASAARAEDRPIIWFHGVSVGEIEALTPLIEAWKARRPEDCLLVSTATETGQDLARRKAWTPGVFYFPLDLPWVVARVLDQLTPSQVIVAETELWPNFSAACRRRRIPLHMVNTRISDGSFDGYRRIRGLVRPMLRACRSIAAQTEEDARRLHALGAPSRRLRVCGNLKFDATLSRAARPPATAGLRAALGVPEGAPLWIAGSTHEGEDEFVLEAHRRALDRVETGLRLILAPRHPERAGAVESLCRRFGLPAHRRSAGPCPAAAQSPHPVLILDTIGELSDLYALAQVAFIGGSLVDVGGHNPLEAMVQGTPVIIGPRTHNFREILRLARAARACVEVERPSELAPALERLLLDPGERSRLGEAGKALVAAHRGATERHLDWIDEMSRTAPAALDPALTGGDAL